MNDNQNLSLISPDDFSSETDANDGSSVGSIDDIGLSSGLDSSLDNSSSENDNISEEDSSSSSKDNENEPPKKTEGWTGYY